MTPLFENKEAFTVIGVSKTFSLTETHLILRVCLSIPD